MIDYFWQNCLPAELVLRADRARCALSANCLTTKKIMQNHYDFIGHTYYTGQRYLVVEIILLDRNSLKL
jgi:hypothetical protein